jgi:hypothetical protein
MACAETLPVPNERWNHMCFTPHFTASRATFAEIDGCVTTMTASTRPGTERISG